MKARQQRDNPRELMAARTKSRRKAAPPPRYVTWDDIPRKIIWLGTVTAGLGAIGTAWVWADLPVLATTRYVQTVIESVSRKVSGVNTAVLSVQLEQLKTSRANIMREQSNLEINLKTPRLDSAAAELIRSRQSQLKTDLEDVEKKIAKIEMEMK